jgi:hypothetical protein
MRPLGSLAVLATVSAFCASPGYAQFQFTTLDHPLAGRGGTTAYDVSGDNIVGTFLDAAGASHGFSYDGMTWSVLDHPSAALPRGTAAYGISDGVVCGTYVDAAGRTFGYLYDGATWTTIQRPPLATGPVDTFARGLSGGTVVGYSIEGPLARGFVYSGGNFSDLLVPGAVGTFPDDTDGARVVGMFEDLLGSHGFIATAGIPVPLDYPLDPQIGTSLTGVDGQHIVGNYVSLTDGSSHGFLFDGLRFERIDFPGATDTIVNGIDGSRIVGSYTTATGDTHGFIAVVPEPAGGLMAILGSAVFLSRHARRRRFKRSRFPSPAGGPAAERPVSGRAAENCDIVSTV